ncbi:MAG: zinc metalloprotease HtpX [Planctomycetota bacterium]
MPLTNLKKNKATNSLHSILLIFGMTVVMAVIGWALANVTGMIAAIVLALISVILGERISPRIILRMYKARPILPNRCPELAEMFHQLCRRAELEAMPGLYYIPSKMPNAFAVGHDKTAAVAVTDGLLRMMNPRELEGVLAHEVAHLRHRDTYVMGLADTISRITSTISRIGLIMMLFGFSALFFSSDSTLWFVFRGLILFFAPTATVLLQLALSRSREFNADLGSVELTGDPYGLASGLDKLDRLGTQISLWQKVLTPGRNQQQPALLRTHPPTRERIERLVALTTTQQAQIPAPVRQLSRPTSMSPVRVRDTRPRKIEIGFEPRVRRKPRYHILSGTYF